MSFELALRLTEILMALAFIQQSLEHCHKFKDEQLLFLPRAVLSLLLIIGFQTPWVCLAMVINSLFILKRFQGPYNGGSDRMGLLILCCVTLGHFMPTPHPQQVFFGYLAVQLVLSYFISGFVKIINPDWRSGLALQDVFRFSVYPVSEATRKWTHKPYLLFLMSWAVILFEILFPLTLLNQETLIIGLVIASFFHLANAVLFGLNRFLWIWIAAYPSIFWLQQQIFATWNL